MSFRNKGTTGPTVIVSVDPDWSGNYVCSAAEAHDVTIQRAFTYLDTIGGGTVHLREGTFTITATLTLGDDTVFEGEGFSTILDVTADVNGVQGQDRTVIRNMRINDTGSSQSGIYYFGRDWFDIDNVYIYGFRYGIRIRQSDSDGGSIHNSFVLNCDDYGIYLERSIYVNVYENYIEGVEDRGIASLGSDYLSIHNNKIVNIDPGVGAIGTAIMVQNHASDAAINVKVIGNTINLVSDVDSSTINGITISGESSDTYETRKIVVEGNTVNGDDGAKMGTGIYVHGDTAVDRTARDIVIDGNTVDGMDRGIVVTYAQDCIVSDNSVDAIDEGILISNSLRTAVDNNHVNNCTIGIQEGGTDNMIGRNFFYNCTTVAVVAGTDVRTPWVFMEVTDPDTNVGDHPALVLPDTVDTPLRFQVPIPLEFQALVTAHVIVTQLSTAGPPNMQWSTTTDWGKLCAGENYNAGSDAETDQTTAVTINQLNCINVAGSLTGIAAGDLVGFTFIRRASQAGDTINDNAYYLGFRLRYV